VPLIVWSGGRAVFAFGAPFAAGLLLAGVVLLLGVPGGRVALVNGAFAALDGTGVPAPLFAVGAVIAALGLGFGVTAATVVVLAAADDAVAGPRDAWRWSVHHWRLVVEAKQRDGKKVSTTLPIEFSCEAGGPDCACECAAHYEFGKCGARDGG
jgi:hypothetical protein